MEHTTTTHKHSISYNTSLIRWNVFSKLSSYYTKRSKLICVASKLLHLQLYLLHAGAATSVCMLQCMLGRVVFPAPAFGGLITQSSIPYRHSLLDCKCRPTSEFLNLHLIPGGFSVVGIQFLLHYRHQDWGINSLFFDPQNGKLKTFN